MKQVSSQLQQIGQHENMASQQIQQLYAMCNQLIQENQRLKQATQYSAQTQFSQQSPTQFQ
ncbi:hypothetical protein [Halalkalibacter urbisdiaboli]|uniref:hypothetical protein n=1 Tax=Halalkalibacter urbisdiaboli TaxID=1960589 RepID=UPI000B44BE0C|nr:hypothetical protein [Halalkalibacter urbisdiaboli]